MIWVIRLFAFYAIAFTATGWVCLSAILHRSFKERNAHTIIYLPIICPCCDGEGMVNDDLCSLCDGTTEILSQISGREISSADRAGL